MKKIIVLISAMLLSVLAFCSAPDSTTANLIAEAASGLYLYVAPKLNSNVTYFLMTLFAFGIPQLLKFAAELKADPSKQALSGWVGFIANTLTWFVKNVQASQTQGQDQPYSQANENADTSKKN